MSEVTRDPAGKPTSTAEGAIGGSLSIMLYKAFMEQGFPDGQSLVIGALAGGVIAFLGSLVRDLRFKYLPPRAGTEGE